MTSRLTLALRAFSKAHRSRLAILCGAVASVLSLTTLFFSHRLGGELNTVQFQGLISLELTVVLPMLVFFGHKIGRYFRSIDPGSKDRH